MFIFTRYAALQSTLAFLQLLNSLAFVYILVGVTIRTYRQILNSKVYTDSIMIRPVPAVWEFHTYANPPIQSIKGYSRIPIFSICGNTSMFSKFYPVQLLFISFPAGRKSFKFNMRITKLYLDIILIEFRH